MNENEIIERLLKYLFIGASLAFIAYTLELVGPKKISLLELLVLCLSNSAVIAVLDVILPANTH